MKVKRTEASGLKKWSMVGRHAGLLSVVVLSGSLCASIAQTESAGSKTHSTKTASTKKSEKKSHTATHSALAHCHRQPHLEDSP